MHCNFVMRRFVFIRGYDRINALKNLREEILAPYLNVYAADQAFPNEEIELKGLT